MKINIGVILFMSFVFFSCYEDHSNDGYQLLPSIEIDKDVKAKEYLVYQHERLKIEPVVYKEGMSQDNFTYKWEVKDWGLDQVISREKVLDTIISIPPTTNPYSLLFTVTDRETGISAYKIYEVKVSPSLGEGLVVADTKDDGLTSDLSLIMAMNFSSGREDESSDVMRREIYSKYNGRKIEGSVVSMLNTNYGTNRSLTVLTPAELIRIEPYTYTYVDGDQSVFIIPPSVEEIKPQQLVYLSYIGTELLLMDGHMYSRSCQHDNRVFSYYAVTNDLTDYYGSHIVPLAKLYNFQANIGGFIFDTIGNRRLLGIDLVGQKVRILRSGSELFDPNHIGKKSCLFMGETKGKIVNVLLKDDGQEHYEIYALKGDQPDKGNLPCGRYDVSACPDIAASRFYEFSLLEDIFYYATDQAIYAVEYLQGASRVYRRYTVETPGAEKITSMKLWRNAGKVYIPSDDPEGRTAIASASRMMIITTYNENTHEGKVICLPIATLGVGGLVTDRAFHKTYGGFGKILQVTYQDE